MRLCSCLAAVAPSSLVLLQPANGLPLIPRNETNANSTNVNDISINNAGVSNTNVNYTNINGTSVNNTKANDTCDLGCKFKILQNITYPSAQAGVIAVLHFYNARDFCSKAEKCRADASQIIQVSSCLALSAARNDMELCSGPNCTEQIANLAADRATLAAMSRGRNAFFPFLNDDNVLPTTAKDLVDTVIMSIYKRLPEHVLGSPNKSGSNDADSSDAPGTDSGNSTSVSDNMASNSQNATIPNTRRNIAKRDGGSPPTRWSEVSDYGTFDEVWDALSQSSESTTDFALENGLIDPEMLKEAKWFQKIAQKIWTGVTRIWGEMYNLGREGINMVKPFFDPEAYRSGYTPEWLDPKANANPVNPPAPETGSDGALPEDMWPDDYAEEAAYETFEEVVAEAGSEASMGAYELNALDGAADAAAAEEAITGVGGCLRS
jgi:hypothetical protein